VTTERKTLKLRPPSDAETAPTIKKKGRGWVIGEKRLDTLHERAREMRRNPTPAQAALAAALATTDTGGFSFRQHAVIGSAIVDFVCKPLMMVLDFDGDADDALSASRDRSLAEVGYRVLRLPAGEVVADPQGAAEHVVAAMRERWHERRERERSHPSPRTYRSDHARHR
jgi:very-short-patch-repair endonuclease